MVCVWYVNWPDRGPCPPGKETNIAFILRSGPTGEFPKEQDDQLCFLMNNGQYIGYISLNGESPGYPFVNALDDATGFAFPGHDIHHLPTAFTDAVQNTRSWGVLNIYFGQFASIQEWPAISFTMSQVTPPLSSIQASGKGDGLDFAWVDLTDTALHHVSFAKADFSHCNLTNAKFTGGDGATVRIERLGDKNQLQIVTETCNVTQLGVTNMNGATICPNGVTLSANQAQSGQNWDERWLRATALPKPPTCVPTDYNWCPATATSTGSAPDSIQHNPELTRST